MIKKEVKYYAQLRDVFGNVIYIEGEAGGAEISSGNKTLRLHWQDWDELYRILNEMKAEMRK